MKNKKIIIVDIDDTLLYTYRNIFNKTNIILNTLGFESINYVDFINLYQYSNFLDYVKKLKIGKEYYHRFLNLYKDLGQDISYKSIGDIKQLLYNYKNIGYDLGIITNGTGELTYKKIEFLKLNPFVFEFILHSDNLNYLKPNNKIINISLKNTLLNYNSVYYIGDSLIDYKTTINTKVKFIAVTTGLDNKESFVKEGLNSNNIIDNIMLLNKLI